MILPPVDTTPVSAKIITLKEVMNRYRPGVCQHNQILVDEQLNDVECGECGAKLNPVAVLGRFAREETQWWSRLIALRELQAKLEAKSRCKCQHCGKFTRVKP